MKSFLRKVEGNGVKKMRGKVSSCGVYNKQSEKQHGTIFIRT